MAQKMEATAKLDNHRFSQRSVPLLDHSKGIEYCQSAETIGDLRDHVAHHHKFADEVQHIAEVEEAIREADYYVHALYTYRSFSKPLPMIPAELEQEDKAGLYKRVFEILTPQINKIKGLMEFHDRFVKIFTKNLRLLVYPFERKEPLWQDHMRLLNRMVDRFAVLDSLKDTKGEMRNDFARYKRAFSFVRNVFPNSADLMAEITAIHNFLNDPQHPYHVVLFHLKEDVRQVPHRDELIGVLVRLCLEDLQNHMYLAPEDKHSLYRTILAHLYLVDDGDTNAFKSSHIPIKEIRQAIKLLPYLPLFKDTSTSTPLALAMCEHYTRDMESNFISRKHRDHYNLVMWRQSIQSDYTQFVANYVTLLHELRCVAKDEQLSQGLKARAFNTVLQGLKYIGDWTAKVKELVVFKSANPVDDARYTALGGKGGSSKVYEQITRFNYENAEKYAMVEVIGLVKGLANMLLENETELRPVLASFVHGELQIFCHRTLLMPLFRSYKKKKGDLQDTLLTMRLIVADCFDITMLREDFKKSKEKNIKKMEPHKWPSRSAFPARTQVLVLRRLLLHIMQGKGMQAGFFGTNDLKKEEATDFERLYEMLFFVPLMANFRETVTGASDLADLWYREFYLNLTGCIQFPIAMSLPWMLTEFAMNTPSLAPNVFFPLAIYNDCAEQALTLFHQQHLFDEIEAEVNLVFDQLIFSLYRKIFDYYKNKAASMMLDKPFQRRMEQVRSKLKEQMQLNYARYGPLFQQKCLNILGRSVDIPSLLTEQLNIYIRENVDAIISRYESTTITAVMEIQSLMDTLRLTVEMLRKDLPGIDPFDDILVEVNEDTTLGSFRGRLFLATYNQMFSGLLRNYIFNQFTRRFVSLDRPKGAKRVESSFLWGSRFTQVYHQIFKVTRGFFGVEHMHAIVKLMGTESMPLLVDELVKTVAHVIIRDISPYVQEILKSLDPMKQQPAAYGVLGVFGYYELVLQFIKSYPALREGVYTLLREAGNALCLVQMLDDVLTHESFYDHQIRAFFTGQEPATLPEESKTEEIKYSSAAAVSNRPKEIPFIRILQKTLEAVQGDKRASNILVKEQELFQSCIRNGIARLTNLRENGGWLFSATLDYLYKLLIETKLLEEWRGPPPKNGILDHENPKDFARFWSVATWIFLCPDFSPEDEAKQRESGYVSDRAFFGDGWLWAGTTILFLTGLKSRYRLWDPVIYIHKLQSLYPENLNPLSKKQVKKLMKAKKYDERLEGYKPFVSGLLQGWSEMERNADLIYAILESHYTPNKHPVSKFTPRWEQN